LFQTEDLGVHVDLLSDRQAARARSAMVKHDQRHIVPRLAEAAMALDVS
jgi:hypothetical protein